MGEEREVDQSSVRRAQLLVFMKPDKLYSIPTPGSALTIAAVNLLFADPEKYGAVCQGGKGTNVST